MWNGPKLFPTDPTSLLSQEPEASMRRPTWLSHFLNKIQGPEIKFLVFMPQPHFYYLNNIPNSFFLVLFPPRLLVAQVEVKRPLLGRVSLSSIIVCLIFSFKISSSSKLTCHFFFLILSINRWETLGKLLPFLWISDEVFYTEMFSLPSGI